MIGSAGDVSPNAASAAAASMARTRFRRRRALRPNFFRRLLVLSIVEVSSAVEERLASSTCIVLQFFEQSRVRHGDSPSDITRKIRI
eukprot:scaffold20569_cov64-Cylindrotheca_fusiformis.AAC.1